jgi:HSP20 family protein
MAEQNAQGGGASPQDLARQQAMQSNQAHTEMGRQGGPQPGQPYAAAPQGGSGHLGPGASTQGGSAAQSGTGAEGPRTQGTQREELFPTGWAVHPFGMMSRMFEEMERFFEELGFGRSRALPRPRMLAERATQRALGALWSPQIEMSERDGQLVVCADLPGLRKEDVKVELTDDALTIQGERQEQREGRGYSERTYGNFYRSVPLPEGVSTDGAQASFQDGVLEVRIPMPRREPQQKQRRLEIR